MRERTARRGRASIIVAIAVLLGAGLVPAEAESGGAAIAVHAGSGPKNRIDEFEERLGVHVPIAQEFFGNVPFQDWHRAGWVARSHPDRRLSLSVAMLPPGESLVDAAFGRHAEHWRALAESLVAGDQADAYVAIGVEFNGDWFRWSIKGNRQGLYRLAYRRAVDAMRSVPGQNFQFLWIVAGSGREGPVEPAYPGDDYVDVIGANWYDENWRYPPNSSPDWVDQRWREMVERPAGLAWLAGFAAEHHKPMAFTEWGLLVRDENSTSMGRHGGGDNPELLRRWAEWLDGHDVLFHAYFDKDTKQNQHRISDGAFPESAAIFAELFTNPAPEPGSDDPGPIATVPATPCGPLLRLVCPG